MEQRLDEAGKQAGRQAAERTEGRKEGRKEGRNAVDGERRFGGEAWDDCASPLAASLRRIALH